MSLAFRSTIRSARVSGSALCAVLLAASQAYATPVRLHVQAPIDYNNPLATHLDWAPEYGQYPAYNHDFKVPYDTLESLIDSQLAGQVPSNLGGTVVCTDPCPDVTWSVKIKPKFKFTKKNQPVVTQIGSSGQSKLRVELTSQARLDVHADVHAETIFDSTDAPVDIYLIVGVKASVEVELWPEIKALKPGTSEPGMALELTLDGKNIDLELNGQAVALGAKWGTIVGLSPVGLLVGGPILGPILAILGNEAADVAEDKISEVFYAQADNLFNQYTSELEGMASDALNPYIVQANAIKTKVLDTKLKGVNKSLNELTSLTGMTIALHTTAPSGGAAVSVVARFPGTNGAGEIQGKARFPKKTCEYVKINGGPLKGATIPVGLVDFNQEFADDVGKACSTLAGKLARDVYLGANPQRALGNSAQALAEWKPNAGTFAWSGNMTQTEQWYECAFKITGLPNAAIVKLKSDGWLDQRGARADETVLEAKIGTSLLFDEHFKAKEGNLFVAGGPGQCNGGGGGGRGIPQSLAEKIKDMLNPEKCPQCGILGKIGVDQVINVNNGDAFVQTAVGKSVVTSVQKARGGALQPATVAPVRAIAAPAAR